MPLLELYLSPINLLSTTFPISVFSTSKWVWLSSIDTSPAESKAKSMQVSYSVAVKCIV